MIKILSNPVTEKGLQNMLNHTCRVGAQKALSLPMRLERRRYLRLVPARRKILLWSQVDDSL